MPWAMKAAQTPPGAQFLAQPLAFDEAIDAFRGRLPLTPDQFVHLGAEAKAKAFCMAGVYREDMLAQVYGAIDKAVAQGTTFADFQREARRIWGEQGLAVPQTWRLKTIFNTNVQTAYQAGHYRQLSRTVALRPFWQYMAVMDGRTRPSHAALNGRVWRADDPVWNSIFPPNGFNCRCTVSSLDQEEMADEGLRLETEPPAMKPDPGWDYNPGRAHWGEGHMRRVLGQAVDEGGWQPLDRLLPAMDAPPAALPKPAALPPDLPPGPDDLLRQVGGSPEAARETYRQEAIKRIGFPVDEGGQAQGLDLVDVVGDRVLLSPRLVDYAAGKDQDLGRGRYVGLAREAIEQADEVWLIPGAYPDGRVTLRRHYIKGYQDENGSKAILALVDFDRRVWTAFNAFPKRLRGLDLRRVGILLKGLR